MSIFETLKENKEMVFYYQNCSVRKNCSSDREKLLKFDAEFCKLFEITRTIYSNSERSEHFLVTDCNKNEFN